MKWLKDKILPGLIVLIFSCMFTVIEKIAVSEKSEQNKTTDDRQDECLQDRIDHDRVQDSLIFMALRKNI